MATIVAAALAAFAVSLEWICFEQAQLDAIIVMSGYCNMPDQPRSVKEAKQRQSIEN
jgi:hypothetical protein